MRFNTYRIFLIWLILLCFNSDGQITFQKSYGSSGEYFNASIPTTDHGFIFVGSTLSQGAGNSDVLVVKIDSVGNQQWSKTYGDTANDFGNFIIQDQLTQDFVISGYTESFGSPQGVTYIIRIDSIGNLIWANIYPTLLGSSSNCIKKTYNGGYISTGEILIGNPGNPNSQIYLLKIDSLGNEEWSKSYGGVDFDYSTYVQQIFDGGFIVTGTLEDISVFGLKTNSDGIPLWSKVYYGGGLQFSNSIEQTTDSGFVLAGTSAYNVSNSNGFLLKADSIGNITWVKQYGGLEYDSFRSAIQTSDGGYIALGLTRNNSINYSYLVKTDPIGDTLWTSSYGDSIGGVTKTINESYDRGFIFGGVSMNQVGKIIKTSSQGESCNQQFTFTEIQSPSVQNLNYSLNFADEHTSVVSSSTIVNVADTSNLICIDLRVEEIQPENKILIYPNPAEKFFNVISNTKLNNLNLQVINSLGTMVLTNKMQDINEEINIENLTPGLYLVRLFDSKNQLSKLLVVI